MLHRDIMIAAFVYALLPAMPFMPAVEVGTRMLMIFGGENFLPGLPTKVCALMVPCGVGRLVPPRFAAGTLAMLPMRAKVRETSADRVRSGV